MTDISNKDNAAILTYDRWLRRQIKQYPTRKKLAAAIIDKSRPLDDHERRFLIDVIEHPRQVHFKDLKTFTSKQREGLIIQADFIGLLENGLSQNNAVSILAKKNGVEESSIRARLGKK